LRQAEDLYLHRFVKRKAHGFAPNYSGTKLKSNYYLFRTGCYKTQTVAKKQKYDGII
jgi:hypothetical protein